MRLDGYVIDKDSKFLVEGRKIRLGKRGVRVLNMLANIACKKTSSSGETWLLPCRAQIRELEQLQHRIYLIIAAKNSRNPVLQCLAIMIRGRCHGTFGVPSIVRLYDTSDPAIRRHVVRCLKRLGAWAELRHIAEAEMDAKIQQLATQTPGRPFEDRRKNFLEHIPRLFFEPGQPPLVIAPDVDFQHGKPAKPISLIRAVLERIHKLVSGWRF